MSKVVLVVKTPVDILVFGEFLEGLAICLLLVLPPADDLLRGDFRLDPRAFLEFKIGHAEDVGGAGEGIIIINHK